MSIALTNFLLEVGEHPDTLIRFRRNPEEIMRQAGLSATEIEAVASGNSRQIKQALLGIGDVIEEGKIFIISQALIEESRVPLH